MSFLVPTAFALAALIPVIVAMYLLKLRREDRLVSSVYLWQRMVRDVEANAPWQRLRRNLLLLLQILFLAVLILTLARPFLWTEGTTGSHAILILDTSASMAAQDVRPDRLAAAKRRAQTIIASLPEDARTTVIAAGENAQVMSSATSDRLELRRVIDSIQITGASSDMSAALNLAAAIAARQTDTEMIILSDGNVTLPEGRSAILPADVRYVPIGTSGANQALSALSLRESDGKQSSLFVQVANYGRETASRRLNVTVDDQLFDAHDLDIAPGDQTTRVLDDLPAEAHVVEARLVGQDALPLDDRAWVVPRDGDSAAISLVTDGNAFLETALGLLPGLEVTTIKPADYDEGSLSDRRSPTSTLTILDATIPLTATLPASNLLFVAPPRSTEFFSVTGVISRPHPLAAGPDEPLLRHVDLRDVQVLKATQMALPEWGRTQIVDERSDSPLLVVGETEGRRIGVLAFDMHHTDLGLRPAFPLLLSNVIDYLTPGAGDARPGETAPGQALTFRVRPEVEEVVMKKPDGERLWLTPEAGQVTFADTDKPGVYRASWRDGTGEHRTVATAVNLFSPQESDVAPQENLPIGGTGTSQASTDHRERARRELWRPLGVTALIVLLIEWIVYHRSAAARAIEVITNNLSRLATKD